jgi:hypothetical protein
LDLPSVGIKRRTRRAWWPSRTRGKPLAEDWLSRIDKDSKEERNRRIFDMWMACHTLEEIAEVVNVHKDTVSEICRRMEELPKSDKSTADHSTDFTPPIYNIWKQQEKSEGVSHFGNSEVRWVDNLLYLYTQPFDVVVDPCERLSAGGDHER